MTQLEDRPIHDKVWLRAHLDEERREADLLAEIREAVFGAQDGVTSILAVVSAVAVASNDTYPVLVAGLAATLAEVFSMGAGEYISSKSQREIFLAQIAAEREEVLHRPDEAEAEVALLFEHDGLDEAASRRVAAEIARNPGVLLKTMVEKELGIALHEGGSPLQGALILAGAFLMAALVPLAPYFFLEVSTALLVSIGLSGVTMFALGVVKARWTKRNPLVSGLQILLLVAGAALAGTFFGSVLPGLLGVVGIR
ncbi:MAG TPA: VIT1/CCC1 transporter family protein [Candidatus Saccharimonadales bacterium]|nr:VIT1/CCC1 transporter family protein [Candidatus Saccharimonadales bacterium]